MPKLHIPGSPGLTVTACGRQLNNHRTTKAQDAIGAAVSTTAQEYLTALASGKACRHCGREAGLLPRLTRTVQNSEDSDNE